jgi:uncharacterized protein YbbC (DUF1343 family)
MTEEQYKLLSGFEERFQQLLSLCTKQKAEIRELALKREQEKAMMQQVQVELQALKEKYRDLLTAHVVSSVGKSNDVNSVRRRLLDLVREIDDCIKYIALLNG